MVFHSYRPPGPLSAFVDHLWIYSGFESPRLKERIFPNGTFELVFNLRDDKIRIYQSTRPSECIRLSGGIVSGPYAGFFVTDTALEASVMGVHFKPGGALPFLGFAANELADTHIDLQTIWGRTAADVREQLCYKTSPVRRFRLLERFLLSRLPRSFEHHDAVSLALSALGTARCQTTHELAHDACLSEKRFIEVFRSDVGLNPRLFTRIRRFQRVLARTRRYEALDWAELAVDHGYFDQSHLIRDFVAFSGCTPAEYMRRLDDLRSIGLEAKTDHLPLGS